MERLRIKLLGGYTVLDDRTGDDFPAGTRTFHATWLSGPNSTGTSAEVEMPVPFGPRNWGHSSANTRTASQAPRRTIRTENCGMP